MANTSRNRKNQPPTGVGKNQPRHGGSARELAKRSEGIKARRHHPELNIGDSDQEMASSAGAPEMKRRPKAGR